MRVGQRGRRVRARSERERSGKRERARALREKTNSGLKKKMLAALSVFIFSPLLYFSISTVEPMADRSLENLILKTSAA